jgi:hypothetical protein
MSCILKNNNLILELELPGQDYIDSRFDWSGKITSVSYKGITVTGSEKEGVSECGKGFYNEFGIDQPLGYEQAGAGGLFHKIGVGLLKRDVEDYDFFKSYEVEPADFTVVQKTDSIHLECLAAEHLGIAYLLTKEIVLTDNGFEIQYQLENTGTEPILTNEYCHNFLNLKKTPVGPGYRLKFPFELNRDTFDQIVNPEGKAEFGERELVFSGTPQEAFFFSNLSGGKSVPAGWSLENTDVGIGISETLSEPTKSVNLWGLGHVISPELFFNIDLEPGKEVVWTRAYSLYELEK